MLEDLFSLLNKNFGCNIEERTMTNPWYAPLYYNSN